MPRFGTTELVTRLAQTEEEIQLFLESVFTLDSQQVRLAQHKDFPHWEVYNEQTGRYDFMCSAPAEIWQDSNGNWIMISHKYLQWQREEANASA